MIMTLRWFGKNFDSVTLKQIRHKMVRKEF